MHNRLDDIQETLLMGPGPSCVFPEVYRALSRPTLGHLDPAFIALMDDIKVLQQQAMGTKNNVTLPISGTGSAGMETCFVNLVEAGDTVLVLVNGVFGARMVDVAGRLGAIVDKIDFEWGTPVIPERVEQQLKTKAYRIVAVVHAETSTGVANPICELAPMVKASGALFLVDCVTSLGGIPVTMDAWGADAMYSGTQKCLSCPPGLSPVSFSEQAVAKLQSRKSKVPNWYLDLSMIINYWGGGAKRVYHHTAPINMLYGLYQSLLCLMSEGLEKSFARHRQQHEALVAGLEGMGLSMLVNKTCRLPMLNAVKVPDGEDEAAVRKQLLEKNAIEIGAGLGPLAGKIWRIGLMGHTARAENVHRVLAALRGAIARY
jgi:alanine-glyoxylate transaminase/serine-glyoxylate transaminase/serine-pyruvate transaminase